MSAISELEVLLTAPAEALDVEYKSWLDLKGDDEHKATLAKAAIAIANEGGGYMVAVLLASSDYSKWKYSLPKQSNQNERCPVVLRWPWYS